MSSVVSVPVISMMYRFRLVFVVWLGLVYYVLQYKLPQEIQQLVLTPNGPRLHFHFYLSFVLVSLLFMNIYTNTLWFRPLFMSWREISNEIFVQRIESTIQNSNQMSYPNSYPKNNFNSLPFYCQPKISIFFQLLFTISGVILSLLLLRLYTSTDFENVLSSEKKEYQQIWKGMTTLLPLTIWFILPFSSILDWFNIPIPNFQYYTSYIALFTLVLFLLIYSSLTRTYLYIQSSQSLKLQKMLKNIH
uniref:Uncharacterized protein n=1 Tax=viral metagenome TaxID=1070528 RepID=A0A6C0D038_9ZZZZ